MSRVSRAFERAAQEGRGALVVYITAGDPNLQVTRELVRVIHEAGADIIELGMPYSDPIADGPTIQAAGQRALAAGTTLNGILAAVSAIRQKSEVPLVLMTCFNPILQHGLGKFAARAAEAGIDGVLVSDLPPEEADEWVDAARAEGLDTIFLAAPTTPADRARRIAELSRGFLYAVSRPGVTGVRDQLPEGLADFVAMLKSVSDLPVAVGFGISRPEQVRAVCSVADGAIVGSAVVEIIARLGGAEDVFYAVQEFVSGLARATRRESNDGRRRDP
ncbi:MAG: tryptophan synthase subunit alpha [Armatimonadetes bacterium]|nr:tryptophan synthase subunit alpha [Armatimonadota bacterium]